MLLDAQRIGRKKKLCSSMGIGLLGLLLITPLVFAAPELVEEIYVFDGKTVTIIWDDETFKITAGLKEQLRTYLNEGLYDGGLLESWLDTGPLPSEFNVYMRYLGSGAFKDCYVVTHERREFVVGRAKLTRYEGSEITEELEIIRQVHTYWEDKVPEARIPVPKAGAVTMVDNHEVYTMGYLDGINDRATVIDIWEVLGGDTKDILNKCFRRESAMLWKIWKGSGGIILKDHNQKNVVYVEDGRGFLVPKGFDFSAVSAPSAPLGDLFGVEIPRLKSEIEYGYLLKRASMHQALLGFYDGMRQDAMTYAQIEGEIESLTLYNEGAVEQALKIIREGRGIEWIERAEEIANVGAEREAARRAVQVALIEGDYGLWQDLVHAVFPGEERSVSVEKLTGQYLYSDGGRDYYRVAISTREDWRAGVVGVAHDRHGNSAALRAEHDALKAALVEREMSVAAERVGDLTGLDYELGGSPLVRDMVVEQLHGSGALATEVLAELTAGSPSYLAVLKAQAAAYARLYKATLDPLTVGERTYERCVLGHPDRVWMVENVEGVFSAMPLDFTDVRSGVTSGGFIDHYFEYVGAYLNEAAADAFMAAVAEELGLDFLTAAAVDSSVTAARTAALRYLERIASDGMTEIGELLKALGYEDSQLGYARFVEAELARLGGKTVMVNGDPHTIPDKPWMQWTVEDVRAWQGLVDAALGEDVNAGTLTAYSDEQVARAFLRTLEKKITPSPLDWQILNVVGINTIDDLNNLLYGLSLTTSKGYEMTPRKLATLSTLSDDVNPMFLTYGIEELLNTETPSAAQGLDTLFMTQGDLLQLKEIYMAQGAKVPAVYARDLHAVICFTTKGYFHELGHAGLAVRVQALMQEAGLGEAEWPKGADLTAMNEGAAEVRAGELLAKLDQALMGQISEASIPGYDFGLFGAKSRAVGIYLSMTEDIVQWFVENGIDPSPVQYRAYAEAYLAAAEAFEDLGLSSGTDFVDSYFLYCAERGYVPLANYLSTRLMPIALFFEPGGAVKITYANGEVSRLERPEFRQGYCDKNGVFAGPDGSRSSLDVSATRLVKYINRECAVNLLPPFTVYVAEMGLYPFYFVHPSGGVDMYYKAARVGRATFSLLGPDVLLFESLHVNGSLVARTVLDAGEVARAMILNVYKRRGEGLTELALKQWLVTPDSPGKVAMESLVAEGYLTDLGVSGYNRHYHIEGSLWDARFLISTKGVPGTLAISGPPEAINVAPGLINGGVCQASGGVMVEPGGKEITFKGLPDGDRTVTIATLLDAVEAAFGAGTRQLTFTMSDLPGTTVVLGDGVIQFGDDIIRLDAGEFYYVRIVDEPIKDIPALRKWYLMVDYVDDLGLYSQQYLDLLPPRYTRLSDIAFVHIHGNSMVVGDAFGVYGMPMEEWYKRAATQMDPALAEDMINRCASPTQKGLVRNRPVYTLDLGSGNKVHLVSVGEETLVFGEGDIFRKFHTAINGKTYHSPIWLNPKASFCIFPNQMQVSAMYYKIPVYADTIKVSDGLLIYDKLKYQQDLVFSLDGNNGVVMRVDTPVEGMSVEPSRWKGRAQRALRELGSPRGGCYFAAIDVAFILFQLQAGMYISSDQLVGDLVRPAALATTWYAGGRAIEVLAQQGLSRGAMYGLQGCSVLLAPLAIVVSEYASCFYSEWRRQQDVDERLCNISVDMTGVGARRAWGGTWDDLGAPVRWIAGNWTPYDKGLQEDSIVSFIAQILQERDEGSGEAWMSGVVSRFLSPDEYEEAMENYKKDKLIPTAVPYGDLFAKEITEPIIEGLRLNYAYPWDDRYEGWRLQVPKGYASSYSVEHLEKVAAEVVKGVERLWDKYAGGTAETHPLNSYLGNELFYDSYRIEELMLMAREQVHGIKTMLEGVDDPAGIYNIGAYPDMAPGTYYIPVEYAIPACDTLYALLTNVTLTSAGARAVNLGAGFEGEGEFVSQVTHQDSAVPVNTYTVPADVTFGGVRYHWDVKAHNPVGWGPQSEPWNFISEE